LQLAYSRMRSFIPVNASAMVTREYLSF